jgi:hypothetical protein
MDSAANRRTSERHAAPLVVSIQPLTASRQPEGLPIAAVSRDLSQGGLSFFSDHPLLADLAEIEIQAASSEQTMLLLAERVRCRRIGGMFEIAVRFVEKLA